MGAGVAFQMGEDFIFKRGGGGAPWAGIDFFLLNFIIPSYFEELHCDTN